MPVGLVTKTAVIVEETSPVFEAWITKPLKLAPVVVDEEGAGKTFKMRCSLPAPPCDATLVCAA